MNNLGAAEFEDAGNNLVQIKCDSGHATLVQ